MLKSLAPIVVVAIISSTLHAADSGGVIDGRVVADGQPVPAARVSLWSDEGRLGTTTTDQDGRFELKSENAAAEPPEPGRYYVLTQADDYAPMVVEVPLTDQPVKVRLVPGQPLNVQLHDRDGGPWADVPVAVHSYLLKRLPLAVGRSDDRGRADFANVDREDVILRIGEGDQRGTVDVPLQFGPILHVGHPAACVTGTVTDAETGAPLDGFTIERVTPPNTAYLDGSTPQWTPVQYEGSSYTRPFEDRRMQFKFRAPGYQELLSPAFSRIEGDATFDVRMRKQASLEARIVQPNGDAASGAFVLMFRSEEGHYELDWPLTEKQIAGTRRVHCVVTDSTGRFAVTPDVAVQRVVILHTMGYASFTVDGPTWQPANSTEDGEISLQPYGRICGTVVQVDGQPMADHVTFRAKIGRREKPMVMLTSHAAVASDGRYCISQAIPAPGRVWARHETHPVFWQQMSIDAGAEAACDIGAPGSVVHGSIDLQTAIAARRGNNPNDYLGSTWVSLHPSPPEPPETVVAAGVEALRAWATDLRSLLRSWQKTESYSYMGSVANTEPIDFRVPFQSPYQSNPNPIHIIPKDATSAEYSFPSVPPGRYRLEVNGPTIAGAVEVDIPAPTGAVVELPVVRPGRDSRGFHAPNNFNWTEFQLADRTLDGEPFDLADHFGRFVVLCFWSPRDEQSDWLVAPLNRLARQVKDEPRVAILGVPLDGEDAEVRRYLHEHGLEIPQVRIHPNCQALHAFDKTLRPAVILMDQDGRYRQARGRSIATEVWQAVASWDEFYLLKGKFVGQKRDPFMIDLAKARYELRKR